ncbi:MAG: LuxR family transcriptional regulator [Tahibacter sp.]
MVPDRNEPLQQLLVARSAAELSRAVYPIVAAHGFGHWMYALDLPVFEGRRKPFVLGNFPPAWVDRYFSHDYQRIDPLIAHCRAHATPYFWPPAELAHKPRSETDTSPVRRLFAEAASFGLVCGVSIPLHGLGCNWGFVSFAKDALLTEAVLNQHAAELHRLAHFIHEAGHTHAARAEAPDTPNLTAREIECLHWAAAGKTSWEIGRVLGVSERTVVFHLQNAAHKFGVSGRQPAIARAIALGMIES